MNFLGYEKNEIDIMIDIETLGLEPGSIITSIGACVIAPDRVQLADEVNDKFYADIDMADSQNKGFTMEASTIRWHMNRILEFPKNNIVLDYKQAAHIIPIKDALVDLRYWIFDLKFGNNMKVNVWAKPAIFDLAHLKYAYKKLNLIVPWTHREERCAGTLMYAFKDVVDDLDITNPAPHNALEDAKYQARIIEKLNDAIVIFPSK